MVKTSIITPFYVSTSWVLVITHEIFTKAAMITLLDRSQLSFLQSVTKFGSSIDILVFVYSFAWIFLLSSIIPSVILGKERGVFIQFLVILGITFTSAYIENIIGDINIFNIDKLYELTKLLGNPLYASFYLLMPFLLMIIIDLNTDN